MSPYAESLLILLILKILSILLPIKFQRVGSDEGQQRVTAIFSSEATAKKTRYWEPMIQGEAAQRVLRQRSVFVIGCPVVPEDAIVTSLDVTASEKEQLVQELEAHFDISNRSLFMDIHGFSVANGAVADVPQMDDPNYYLFNGNRFFVLAQSERIRQKCQSTK